MTTTSIIYTGPIVNRADAKSQGLKRYFTGNTCKHGHTSQRQVSNCGCITCLELQRVSHSIGNEDTIKASCDKYRKSEKGKLSQKRARYRYRLAGINMPVDLVLPPICGLSDPNMKVGAFTSSSISRIAAYISKSGRDNIGYTNSELAAHIESKFLEGMSWDNYGDWHIDHVIPVKWYVDKGVIDISVINSLSNLQPLWAADNMSKGSTFNYTP